jgi:Oxidoreductase molybdopterin binding domain
MRWCSSARATDGRDTRHPGDTLGTGGMANVLFAGVPLSAVLQKHNVRVDPQVKFVTAEGKDLPMGLEKPDYEHSLPVAALLRKVFLP